MIMERNSRGKFAGVGARQIELPIERQEPPRYLGSYKDIAGYRKMLIEERGRRFVAETNLEILKVEMRRLREGLFALLKT